mmetsp:Transcript_23136/g.72782  ORF Transcript_23136/g.72782 Transcript_23136/m.72782 type:complete len:305 (-) Transcript_23136:994-1908(-)
MRARARMHRIGHVHESCPAPASLLVGAAQDHVGLGIRVLHVPQGSQRGQGLDRVHGLELHLVLQAQEAPLHVLPAGHLTVELPRDRAEGLLGRLHSAEIVTVLQLDVSVDGGHLQGPVVALPVLVGVLIAADLRACPEVGQAAGAAEVEGLLHEGLRLLLRLLGGRLLLQVMAHAALLRLARGDALPLGDLLLVQRRSAEALVLHGLQLLERRLHDVAELRGGRHGDGIDLLAGLQAQESLLLLLLLLRVAQALDALGDGRQRGLALLHRTSVGPADQSPLLGELLVELGVLFVGAGILGPTNG